MNIDKMDQQRKPPPNEQADHSSQELGELDEKIQSHQVVNGENAETSSPIEPDLTSTLSQLKKEQENLQLLYKLSRSLVKIVDPIAVAQDALGLITEALSILRGEVLAIDEQTGQLQVLALVGYNEAARQLYQEKAEMRLQHGLAWQAAQSKEAVALPDVNCSEYWLPIPGLDDDICSAAAVPMLADEKMSGIMTLLSDEYDELNQDRLELLSAMATQVALALQNADLFVSEQGARSTAEVLREAHLELTKSLDIHHIATISLKYLDRLIHYDHAAVVLCRSKDELYVSAYQGHNKSVEPRPLSGRQLPLSKYPLIQRIIETEKMTIVSDTQAEPDWQPVIVGEASRSWLGVPLTTGQDTIGALIASKTSPNYFHDQDGHLAEALAIQTATAIQNGNLYTEVQTNRNRLRRLADQLITMQEAERQRVSRELHDEAGQALNALKVSLGLIRDDLPAGFGSVQQRLKDAGDLADQTLNRIRTISYDLRPPELDTLGLDAALEEFCEDFAQRTRLKIRYEGFELPELADAIRISFYRFLQEALTNVVKHAEASEVKVKLSHNNHQVCLSIADNGRGFLVILPAQAHSGAQGLGLLGMKERFEQLGGSINIASRLGQGTTITACVPWEMAS
ncbi:MAG: GAF domain-containing protein [Anaerolineae bacterium]|nr:GAF domain-containing protein [Anaerolineae bacterium]MCB9105688.1 GAF domain-containing protein [Anaerolineales bacterium]